MVINRKILTDIVVIFQEVEKSFPTFEINVLDPFDRKYVITLRDSEGVEQCYSLMRDSPTLSQKNEIYIDPHALN